MSRSVAFLLVLLFMVASCMMIKPVFSLADVTENTWVTKTPMHQARGFLGVATVNGKIYAIGGKVLAYQDKLRTESKAVGTNEEYDPETDTWTYKKPMPSPMANFGIAVYQNRIYCISGNVNEVYDPATDTWETKKPMPTPRSGVGANVVRGKIYVTGGYIPNSSSLTGSSFVPLNEVYDPETSSWTTKAEMPAAEIGFRSAVIDSKMYVTESKTQIYDAGTDTWSFGKPIPYISMSDLRIAATTGVNAPKRIYGFGGGKTQVYDSRTDSWTFGADMNTTHGGFGVGVVDDLIYVIGGFSMTFPSMLSVYKNPTIAYYATVEQYVPFGYGTPDPTYDNTAPEVAVVSPENKTYYTADAGLNISDIALDFVVDEPVFSVHYVLDGRTPVEISMNTTIAGLSVGVHNVSVFGFDASGNMGSSEAVYFTISEPKPFPTTIAIASVVTVTAFGIGLLIYFKKRKH
jgi:hypothetical protein